LRDRKEWEDRQSVWYEMRHHGLRRKQKPWPGAADMHFPLIDSTIDKFKPFYYQQVFGMEHVASFISMKSQDTKFTSATGQWFDYRLKYKTNFDTAVLTLIDYMLMEGVAVVKPFWDNERRRLAFRAFDPIFFVVPWDTQDIHENADRMTEIVRYSKLQYQRLGDQYNQDPAALKRICGKGETPQKVDDKYRREGLTYGERDDQIIIYETYERTASGWMVHFYSPLAPDIQIRPSMGIPYKHGKPPYITFFMEVKDEGFYSARGVPEILAPFESALCKTWNEKLDAMTLYNRPIYSSEGGLAPAQNQRLKPGQIVNFKLTPVVNPAPGISFDQEMINERMVAEYRIGMPDYGQGQAINTKERKTATEVQNIANLMGQGVDLRARIFRNSLTELYEQCYSLYMQYDKEALDYYYQGELLNVPQEALHDDYLIRPSGSADSFNKQLRYQKAVNRFQMFNNHPFVNQGELAKSVLEEDDPRLVKTLYVEPQLANNDHMEEQADEIGNMINGFDVQVHPHDRHEIHLQALLFFLERKVKTGEPIHPELAALLLKHGRAHWEFLQQMNKQLATQMTPQVNQAVQILQSVIQRAQMEQQLAMQQQEQLPMEGTI